MKDNNKDSNNIEETFGVRLKYVMDELLHISQIDLSRRIGAATTSIRGWLQDKNFPSMEHMDNMTREYGINYNYLKHGMEPAIFPKEQEQEVMELSNKMQGISVPVDLDLGEMHHYAERCALYGLKQRMARLGEGETLTPEEIVKGTVMDYRGCLNRQHRK